MKILNLLWIAFIFCSCRAQAPVNAELPVAPDQNSLLWKVSGNGMKSPSYLYGTFHLLCKQDIHFSENLKKALSSSEKLYLEMDMDDPTVMLGGMMLMNMKGGTTLESLFSKEEYVRVNSFFKDSVGMSLAFFKKIKPFFLEAMLYPKMMPCKTVSGVEEELMALAKKEKKEILGLETIEFQSSVFDSIPYPEQARELMQSIDSIGKYRVYFDSMVKVYQSQRLDRIEQLLLNDEFGVKDNQDLLLKNRNQNWVNQLVNILPKQQVLVAVGTAHLLGKDGLITLLRQKGYVLTPILNK